MSDSEFMCGVLKPTGCDCIGEKAAIPQTHSRQWCSCQPSETSLVKKRKSGSSVSGVGVQMEGMEERAPPEGSHSLNSLLGHVID